MIVLSNLRLYYSYLPYLAKVLKKYNLNIYELAVLNTIVELYGLNVKQYTIYSKMNNSLNRATINKQIKSLIKKEYVHVDNKDYYITERAYSVLDSISNDLYNYEKIDRNEIKNIRKELYNKSNIPPDSI